MTDTLKFAVAPATTAALNRAAAETGDSRTDTINRAVQLYDQLVHAVNHDGARVLLSRPDGNDTVALPTEPEASR